MGLNARVSQLPKIKMLFQFCFDILCLETISIKSSRQSQFVEVIPNSKFEDLFNVISVKGGQSTKS